VGNGRFPLIAAPPRATIISNRKSDEWLWWRYRLIFHVRSQIDTACRISLEKDEGKELSIEIPNVGQMKGKTAANAHAGSCRMRLDRHKLSRFHDQENSPASVSRSLRKSRIVEVITVVLWR
jgi:hypothetical protein